MQVNKTSSDVARTEAAQRSPQSGATSATQNAIDEISSVRRSDAVQISDAGRALSGAAAPADQANTSELDPRRLDEIRSNILSGAYDTLGMADHVARSLMRSGDL
ncbi:MAG: hypothetical protein ACR2MQ_00350 [Gemmatimonadaceae bacterium]